MIGGEAVRRVVAERANYLFDIVKQTYLLHDAGQTVNPASQFLRFPDIPDARIISLIASVRSGARATGMKWIASFPANTTKVGLPRASALLTLNDPDTGFPYAVLEGSILSATRTAMSAVAAAECLCNERRALRVGFIGTGLISKHVFDTLMFRQWHIGGVTLFDLNADSVSRFGRYCEAKGVEYSVATTLESAIRESDLIVIATTALEPHIDRPEHFAHAPTVLHLSLRDLCADVVAASQNFVDDRAHAFSAKTSLELAEKKFGARSFLSGTIADLLSGVCVPERDKARVFSPFGLGILDIAVGRVIYEAAVELGEAVTLRDFFKGINDW